MISEFKQIELFHVLRSLNMKEDKQANLGARLQEGVSNTEEGESLARCGRHFVTLDRVVDHFREEAKCASNAFLFSSWINSL